MLLGSISPRAVTNNVRISEVETKMCVYDTHNHFHHCLTSPWKTPTFRFQHNFESIKIPLWLRPDRRTSLLAMFAKYSQHYMCCCVCAGQRDCCGCPCFFTGFSKLDHMNTRRGYTVITYQLGFSSYQLWSAMDCDLSIWMDTTLPQTGISTVNGSQCKIHYWLRKDWRMVRGDVSHSQVCFWVCM